MTQKDITNKTTEMASKGAGTLMPSSPASPGGPPGGHDERGSVREGETGRTLDILKNIGTAYFECDLKGDLTFFNDVVCRHLGYSRDELMGKNFRDFATPSSLTLSIT